MKHLIVGTAGHVDHGKTALIRALTGIDCDTHKEEKERGITINLGFAHLDLGDGIQVGIVDVPGHRDFVNTMVGGASGIDFVLMVIAADSGVMPQTREHLQILEVLGVANGLIALTKSDRVDDPELLDLCKAELRDLVTDTFLADAPIVEVSAVTKHGLDRLKEELRSGLGQVRQKSDAGCFRMFVDRLFSISGFGSVVTGSVMSGRLNTGDDVYLLPGNRQSMTARRLERHGKEVASVKAGDRASINIAGLNRSDFHRGQTIADRPLKSTDLLDAVLDLFEDASDLDIWSQVVFHSGTYEHQAKLHLLDRNHLKPGHTALVQFHLSQPCVLTYGDRFVIRSSSSDRTLGGGRILNISPKVHRRRPAKLIKHLEELAQGDLADLILAQIRTAPGPISAGDIADDLNISTTEIEDAWETKKPKDIVAFPLKDGAAYLARDRYAKCRDAVRNAVMSFHNDNPMIDRGINLGEIRGNLPQPAHTQGPAVDALVNEILKTLKQSGKIQEKHGTWLPQGATTSDDVERQLTHFAAFVRSFNMQVPPKEDLLVEAKKRGLSERELKQILFQLVARGELVRIQDRVLHRDVVDRCRKRLSDDLSQRPEGITISQFRDLIDGNRKICLLLMAHFDAQGLTRRIGDVRVLHSK